MTALLVIATFLVVQMVGGVLFHPIGPEWFLNIALAIGAAWLVYRRRTRAAARAARA